MTAANVRICEALGLDPDRITRLDLAVTPDAPPRLTVQTFADDDKWAPILETFTLIPDDA